MAGRLTKRAVGIVRETYTMWERRSPLTPAHAAVLINVHNIPVFVQPSTRRCFADSEYEAVGCTLSDNLTEADILIGVKQVKIPDLQKEKTYLFFSHVIKGQPENMPLLDAILEKNVELIDYECLTTTGDRRAPRLIAFGEYAGRAGMIGSIRGLGERLLQQGFNNPFINCASSYMYPSLEMAKDAIAYAGKRFVGNKDTAIFPLTVTFTGNGAVSKGAQEIFQLLPHEMVQPSDLADVAADGDPNKLYGCVVGAEDFTEHKEGNVWNKDEYYQFPERFESTFHEKILPYTSVLINGMFWDNQYPRLVTNDQMHDVWESGKNKLLVVGDITCDVGGSIEFLEKSTTIEDPFFLWDPSKQQMAEMANDDGVLVLGVDILPSEIAMESSQHFSNLLVPLLCDLANASPSQTLPTVLEEACISRSGALQDKFAYIEQMSREQAQTVTTTGDKAKPLIVLRGHLFDSGLINKTFDLLESLKVKFRVRDIFLRPNSGYEQHPSKAVIEVDIDPAKMEEIKQILDIQLANFPDAKASLAIQ